MKNCCLRGRRAMMTSGMRTWKNDQRGDEK